MATNQKRKNPVKIPVFLDGEVVGYVDRPDRPDLIRRMINPIGEGSFGYAFFSRVEAYHGSAVRGKNQIQVTEVRQGALTIVVKGERWRSMSAIALTFKWRDRPVAIGLHGAFPFVRVVYED